LTFKVDPLEGADFDPTEGKFFEKKLNLLKILGTKWLKTVFVTHFLERSKEPLTIYFSVSIAHLAATRPNILDHIFKNKFT
jgi:hypothetical protein